MKTRIRRHRPGMDPFNINPPHWPDGWDGWTDEQKEIHQLDCRLMSLPIPYDMEIEHKGNVVVSSRRANARMINVQLSE